MASKIQGHIFYVVITPYKVEGVEDQYNELSVMTDYNQYTHYFYVSLHAGWRTTFGHGSMIMGDRNPLTASTRVVVKESPKNSQKFINEAGGALELAKADIAWLFDRRMWTELQQFVRDVALYGYTPTIEERMKGYKSHNGDCPQCETAEQNSNINNQTSTTMANETKNAQEYVGKVIVVGDNMATIEIKGVQDNGMLSGEFKKGDAAPIMMPVTIPNLEAMMKRGVWKIQGEAVADEPKATEAKSEDDVEEVQDVVPPTPKTEPKAEKTEKPKAKEVKIEEPKPKTEPKPKQEKPKAETKGAKGSGTSAPSGKYVYETYTTSKGKTGAKITGFKDETDVFYAMAAEIHASGSYDKDKQGNKQYYLCFGPKYAETAKSICKVLNSDKSVEAKKQECVLAISQATQERAARREEGRQKREAYKAENPDGEADGKAAKVYTLKEVEGVVRNAFGALAKQLKTDAKAFEPLIEAAIKAA